MSQQAQPHSFDPNDEKVFDSVRACIEDWQDRVPSTQFKQYGPIDRYLNLKFSREEHIIKPQALFRKSLKEWEAAQREAHADDEDDEEYLVYTEAEYLRDIAGLETHADENATPSGPRDAFLKVMEDISLHKEDYDTDDDELIDPTWVERVEDVVDVLMEAADVSFDSTSNNPVVTGKDGTKFPDFVVCSFYRPRRNLKDKVRVVMEIASAGKSEKEKEQTKKLVMQQLLRYMYRLGPNGDRWKDQAVGIAVVGTEVAFYDAIVDENGEDEWEHFNSSWYSLYGQEFLDRINSATSWRAHE
ncbi:hypothetical protein CONPUDRAFT_136600 [Coniophora puteana RWD-64-598 SS2]|uniref:Uncharacterized protein n=1 Tax=Coniophora puteana (strain RWD-64-598) TaxID=741705 RepID=A0A5M3MSC3_CONPW|nr:uncharacterized protein CONPUDRAFT_136600 [Coniophora puteana RWD-64-598 SS2]EIW81986.1 hypothetical protein CONPUDRAFT_136600 [Coniophora puteana RWD-64-598 SS2]